MQACGVMVVEDRGWPHSRANPRLSGALEHIANRPIAHHVLDALAEADVCEIVVVSSTELVGEIRECVMAWERADRMPLTTVSRPAPLDLAAALTLAAPVVQGAPSIVHLATGLLGEPLARSVDCMRVDSPDLLLLVHESHLPGQHLSPAVRDMLNLVELDPSRSTLGIAGAWLFGPGALQHAASASSEGDGQPDLAVIGERIRSAGGSLNVRLAEAWRRYDGDARDLLELNRVALDGLKTEPIRPDNNGNEIEGRVWIHRRASVRSSVIVGPTVVGPGARIDDAYIGPYTSIGAGARIEGAEVERSIILPGASITHIGGRLVASVVGRDARVFRNFALPRAFRLRVGDGTEVALY